MNEHPEKAAGGAVGPGSWRIPSPPIPWQNFALAFMFHLGFPLFPLFFEAIFSSGSLSRSSIHIVASMYGITIGASSPSRLMFGLGMTVGFIFAAIYGHGVGMIAAKTPSEVVGVFWAWVAIAMMFLLHAAERYNRHVVDRIPFWEFTKE